VEEPIFVFIEMSTKEIQDLIDGVLAKGMRTSEVTRI
jgi:hypothetical protein